MGNDIRSVLPADLAILSNPAVIAVNQDPSGSSASRRWLRTIDNNDGNGPTSTQLWSGGLASTTGGDNDDMVVLLINGHNHRAQLNATLADIFVDSGPAGTAAQVKMHWEVRDLWASRMSDAEAQAIISGASNATIANNGTTGRYNATKTSYAEGLAQKNPLLLGKTTTTVQPSGTIVATVDPHGAALFRLRAVPTGTKKDEL